MSADAGVGNHSMGGFWSCRLQQLTNSYNPAPDLLTSDFLTVAATDGAPKLSAMPVKTSIDVFIKFFEQSEAANRGPSGFTAANNG